MRLRRLDRRGGASNRGCGGGCGLGRVCVDVLCVEGREGRWRGVEGRREVRGVVGRDGVDAREGVDVRCGVKERDDVGEFRDVIGVLVPLLGVLVPLFGVLVPLFSTSAVVCVPLLSALTGAGAVPLRCVSTVGLGVNVEDSVCVCVGMHWHCLT